MLHLIRLNGNVLAAFLSDYGDMREVLPARSATGTAHGDYILNMCLNRKGFQAIPHTIAYKDQNMMVVLEGMRPSVGLDLKRPLNPQQQQQQPRQPHQSELEPGDHPDKEEGWTQVIHKGRNPPTPQNKADNNNNNSNNDRSSSTSINNNNHRSNSRSNNNSKSNSSNNIQTTSINRIISS